MEASNDPAKAQAAQLNEATKAGDIARAYSLLMKQPADLAQRVLLFAGYSVVGPRDRDFWKLAQADIARAARSHTDGFGVRA